MAVPQLSTKATGATTPPSGNTTSAQRSPAHIDVHPLHQQLAALPAAANRTVVVLPGKRRRSTVAAWLGPFSSDRVHIISAAIGSEWRLPEMSITHHVAHSAEHLNWHLKLLGPIDVLLDLGGDPADYPETLQRRFFHVQSGGCYAVKFSKQNSGAFGGAASEWIGSLVDPWRLARRDAADTDDDADGVPDTPADPNVREWSDSTRLLSAGRDFVVLHKQQDHYLKLRDAETNRVLAAREPVLDVAILSRRISGGFEYPGVVISHESGVPIPSLPTRIEYPTLWLRHYVGHIALAGNTLMYTDSSVLPDSFRHHLDADPRNLRLINVSADFARIPSDRRPSRTLPGTFYQLESTFPGHFGHVMTELVSRLWGWPEAKQAFPELKAIFHPRRPREADTALERQILQAYGLAADDIVTVNEPVYLESVVSASPMWHNQVPHYVHPEMSTVWRRLAEGLIEATAPTYDRIFVSRTSRWKRRFCRNTADVERFFEAHGFTVIYPETLDLGVQAAIFANASIIAGFGGSGLFNIMYCRKLQTLILLSHEAYTARNEHLFTSLSDVTVHYFWSAPDIPHPPDGWLQDAFYSGWEFDFTRNEESLRSLLMSL
jgi:capsular polysaccharide biosynthesis protein